MTWEIGLIFIILILMAVGQNTKIMKLEAEIERIKFRILANERRNGS